MTATPGASSAGSADSAGSAGSAGARSAGSADSAGVPLRRSAWLAAALPVVAGIVTAFFYAPQSAVASGLVTGALFGTLAAGPWAYRRIGPIVTVAASITLATTIVSFTRLYHGEPSGLQLVEYAALIWLIILVVRSAPRTQARWVGTYAGFAATTQILRGGFGNNGELVLALAGLATWAVGVAAAVLGGLYLRTLEARRATAVAAARQAQRIDLAHDLHDFVAHDVSGIVVQAQAAQVVADRDPAAVLAALKRIEEAGLQALAAMDRTVGMLRTEPPNDPTGSTDRASSEPARAPVPGVEELPAVVERFSSTGTTRARLELPAQVAGVLPREVGATAYRLVVEALTNVRRHAPGAARVEVRFALGSPGPAEPAPAAPALEAPALEVSVTNDADPAEGAAPLQSGRTSEGFGLVGITERVEALGGRLAAGPCTTARGVPGWRVLARFPLPDVSGRLEP